METNPCNNPANIGFPNSSRVSRKTQTDATIVNIVGVEAGGSDIVVIAGPCAVESQEQLFETARAVKSARKQVYQWSQLMVSSLRYIINLRKQYATVFNRLTLMNLLYS